VEQDVIEVQADAVVVGAAEGEAGVEIVVGGDAGEALHGAEGVVCEDAAEILDVVAGHDEGGGAIGAGGFEWVGFGLHGVGLAEGIGSEDDFEFLGFGGGQVEGLVGQVVADGGNVQEIIAGRDIGNLEGAFGIGHGAVGATGKLHLNVGESFTAAGIDDGAADRGGSLREGRQRGQGGPKQQPVHE
jgi:hypothetical protein